jgi:hypothetical protein
MIRSLRTALLLGVLLPASALAVDADAWRADLAVLRAKLLEIHPDPHAHLPPAEFDAAFDDLRARLPELDDVEVVVGMMAVVARLRDGHTTVVLRSPSNRVFPLRLRVFTEGLYPVVVPETHRDALGRRVLRIGGVPAEEALDRLRAVTSADNAFGRDAWAVDRLLIPELAVALGLAETPRTLVLDLAGEHGVERLELAAITPAGEGDRGWVSDPAAGPPGPAYAVMPEGIDLPEHARGAGRPFWLTPMPEAGLLYAQIAAVRDGEDETLAAFGRRLFDTLDAEGLERLVIDLRHNDGGNGDLLWELIYEIKRHPEIDRPGHLHVITSGETFSAAVMATARLKRHTAAVLVGAPTGAGMNHFGDATGVTLPASGVPVRISTLYWQEGHPSDTRDLIVPDAPVLPSAEAWFAGRDPALETIVAGEAVALEQLFRTRGLAPTLAAFEEQRRTLGRYDWWRPFAPGPVTGLARDLIAAGDTENARRVLEMLLDRYPGNAAARDLMTRLEP